MKIHKQLPPRLGKQDWCAIDLELFQADKSNLHKPTTGMFACVTFCPNDEDVYIVTNEKDIEQSLMNVEDAVWIFHNAKFDITHLRRWAYIPYRKTLWDTMIMEKILWGGYYDLFSLADLARRYLDINMDKDIRKRFEDASSIDNQIQLISPRLDDEMIYYSCYDSLITRRVCEAQKPLAKGVPFSIWKDIDRDALWAFIDMLPIRFDKEKWLEIAKNNEENAKTLEEQFEFNPRSPTQAKDWLKSHGFKRLRTTQEKELNARLADPKQANTEAGKTAMALLEYRKVQKRASTYGGNWVERYVDGDIITSNYNVIGAETGRTSSTKPNFQNIIATGEDGKSYRECFIPHPGHSMIVIDMGQQEARINAYLSQDKNLIEILKQKDKDIFVEMAKKIYNIDITKSDPKRKTIKNIIYGMSYGMSPEGFADRYDCSLMEARKAFKDVFRTFSGLRSYINQQKRKKDYVETIIGRRIWLNPYANQVERNAINSPTQGSAADQQKVAIGRIYRQWKDRFDFPFSLVGFVHDELLFSVPKGREQEVIDFVSNEMIKAAEEQCPGVPFTVDVAVGDSWAVKE
jgi:DNA polymerase I